MIMHKNYKLFFLLFLILSWFNSSAQLYNFKHFNEEKGLIQSYIYSISQSKDGFLSLSTSDGFVTYEGNKFSTFTTKDSLVDNFINVHFIDSKGVKWIGHYQKGISIYQNSIFSKIEIPDSLSGKVISFAEDQKGNIWFSIQGKGIFYIDRTLTLQYPNFNVLHLAHGLIVDSSGHLLCATDKGLLSFNIEKPKSPLLRYNVEGLEYKDIKLLRKDGLKEGLYWVAVPDVGIYAVEQTLIGFRIVKTITNGLGEMNFLDIYSDHLANLWVSVSGEGLKKIKENPDHTISIQTINRDNQLPNLYIQSIFEDYEYNMWFGTFGAGLIQLPIEEFTFSKPSQKENDITSIFVDKDHNRFIGTTKGVFVNGINKQLNPIFSGLTLALENLQINSVFQDKDGLYWFGSESEGLFTFDIESRKIQNFSKVKNLKNLSINHITQNKEGVLLVGTKNGIYFINKDIGKIDLITTYEGLLHNNVTHIFCDSSNKIWFSSISTPPYYLDGNTFTVLEDVSGLKSFSNNCVTEDKNGNIWISSAGDGVFRYDGNDFKNIRVEDGLLSGFCYSVSTNKNNEIWITHKNGFSKLNIEDFTILTYNKSDGLLFTENNLNANFTDQAGNFWFGTSEGLVKHQFSDLQYKEIEPKIQISGLYFNNVKSSPVSRIKLAYNKYNTRIDFIGVSLSDPSKVNYKYRLLGLDTVWKYTDKQDVEYSKLTEGKYVFQVYANNKNEIWNSTPAEVAFEIGNPYWKEIWFWLISIVGIIGTIYFFTIYRIKRLLKTKLILEEKVEIKTQQLREEKEEVEKIKVILQNQNKDITDSIYYAKRIQLALLPLKDDLISAFSDTFIFSRSKDIVSGDFFWFSETKDAYIVAVVDCTGHGVPGAFMSLIGSTILNEIVHNRGINSPAEILSNLNEELIYVLSQKSENYSVQDGMDVSICNINKNKTKMQFSSAARPMYYVRDGELNFIKQKAFSIGRVHDHMSNVYADLQIDLQKGDMFYLFSDGFVDQFDKNDKKKFGSQRLKKLCVEISEKSASQQYEIVENTFYEWKGETEQIDDVTLLGLKI